MKLFPLNACLLVASISLIEVVPSQASECYMVDPSGRKITMDFCGVTNQGTNTPSVPQQDFYNLEETEEKLEAEPAPNLIGNRVTSDNWNDLKSFVAQREGKPVTLSDVKSIIGFEGELVKTQPDGSERWEWKDDMNSSIKVVGIFVNDELKHLSGTVY